MNKFKIFFIFCFVLSFCIAEDALICKPKSVFQNDCNICVCGSSGLDYVCSKDVCSSKKIKKMNSYKDEDEYNDYDLDNVDEYQNEDLINNATDDESRNVNGIKTENDVDDITDEDQNDNIENEDDIYDYSQDEGQNNEDFNELRSRAWDRVLA
ncbi:protein PFC0760c-like [Diorhabda carinulata]|uniref:protein PFC0760c-like n=1 Tax=Diorhabda carinulata TaxID=1163345 RepID=UPI0025A0C09D|nr:protein PFC0760c-like [Diorhabda carinulata]